MGASVQYDSGLSEAYLAGISTPGWVPNWQFHPLWDRLLANGIAIVGVDTFFDQYCVTHLW